MQTVTNYYELKQDNYYSSLRSEMLDFLPKNAQTFLDVGCGTGVFGSAIKKIKNNAIVDGIELMPEAASQAKNILDQVWQGDITELLSQVPDGKYDCITFNDVLEHLTDPYELLKKIKSKLSPQGVIVSSIPNVRYFRVLRDLIFKKDWEYVDSGILDKTHFRFFTKKSILRMFDESGYEVERCEGISKTKSLRPYFYRFFTLGAFDKETMYLQFASVVKPRR